MPREQIVDPLALSRKGVDVRPELLVVGLRVPNRCVELGPDLDEGVADRLEASELCGILQLNLMKLGGRLLGLGL